MIESFVDSLGDSMPFGYAFSAGMVTTVNPCGIAMLPAFVALHLGSHKEGFWSESVFKRVIRALAMSAIVTLAFVFLFGILGIIVSLGGEPLFEAVPWIAVVIGVFLILLGIYLLFGGHLYSNLPAKLAGRINGRGNVGMKGFFVFGLTYGLSALSCALPVFLVVVGGAIAIRGTASGLMQFISYALGMGFIMAIITVGSSLFKETVNRWLHRIIPVITRINSPLLIFAGAYLLYYWFTTGDLI
jgi:cytochrome c-type biogenesis protein